jgi:hypothetical protein
MPLLLFSNAPDSYPQFLSLETPQVNGRYPLVEDPIRNPIWMVPTWLFYWPEPVPTLQPPLHAAFQFDLEDIRQIILELRPP